MVLKPLATFAFISVAMLSSNSLVTAQQDTIMTEIRSLLHDKELLDSLEILDYQARDCQKVISTESSRWSEKTSELRQRVDTDEIDVSTHNTIWHELRAEWYERMDEQIKEIILPHQYQRLKEIAAWTSINRRGGLSVFLQQEDVQKKLELSAGEAKTLKEQGEQLQEDFEKELSELREKYRDKLMSELPVEKRRELKKMLGKPSTRGLSATSY